MGIGDWISKNIMGSENRERAAGRKVQRDAYEYGGEQGGAEEAAFDYTQRGKNAQNRAATQTTGVQINYNQANQDRALGQQARQGANSLASIMANRATGGAPSIAQQQADRQMGQIASQQASMAGSARGAGGLAAAQRNAAFNTANAGADISGQAQINAAGERRDDTNAAAGMYANLRGGDLASQGQMASQAQAQTQNAVGQNQFNAGLRDAQSARNDARQLAYDQMTNQVRTTQLAAQGNREAQQSANTLGAQGINAGVGGQNANMAQQNGMNALGLAQGVAGGVAGGMIPGKARGGPVNDAKPYLVGEEGPELIVPRRDGHVLTHEETKQALAGSPAKTVSQLFDRGRTEARGASLASIMGARAEGGPVMGERDAVGAGMVMPPPPAPAPIPGYQPPMSTWGGSPVDEAAFRAEAEQAQRGRMAPYEDLGAQIAAQRSDIDATASRVNESAQAIDDRDKDAVWTADYKDRHGQTMTRDEEEQAIEARYRQDEDKKGKRAEDKKKRQRSIADIIGDSGKEQQRRAGMIDTAYHGGAGYSAPQLIPLAGARAGGGPISAGGLQPMTPMMGGGHGVGGGIELGPGGGITHNDLLRAGTGLATPQAVPGMVGGGGITGGSSMGGHAIPGMAGAREDGGPVEGEQDAASRAQAEEMKVRDLAFSSPHIGSMYTGQQALTYGAAKLIEHRQKQEAAAAAKAAEEAASKAGRWDGDRFIPAKRYDPSKPFGERFVEVAPEPAREMKSFERTDPTKERDALDHEDAAKTAAMITATAPTIGAATPALAASVTHYLQSIFGKRDAKKSVPDKEEEPRIAAIMRRK